jgi:hypothetical protein
MLSEREVRWEIFQKTQESLGRQHTQDLKDLSFRLNAVEKRMIIWASAAAALGSTIGTLLQKLQSL